MCEFHVGAYFLWEGRGTTWYGQRLDYVSWSRVKIVPTITNQPGPQLLQYSIIKLLLNCCLELL